MSPERLSLLYHEREEVKQKKASASKRITNPKRCLARSAPDAYPTDRDMHASGAVANSDACTLDANHERCWTISFEQNFPVLVKAQD